MVLFTDIFAPLDLATSFVVQDILTATIVFGAKIVALATLLEIVRTKISVFSSSEILAMSYTVSIIAMFIL